MPTSTRGVPDKLVTRWANRSPRQDPRIDGESRPQRGENRCRRPTCKKNGKADGSSTSVFLGPVSHEKIFCVHSVPALL